MTNPSPRIAVVALTLSLAAVGLGFFSALRSAPSSAPDQPPATLLAGGEDPAAAIAAIRRELEQLRVAAQPADRAPGPDGAGARAPVGPDPHAARLASLEQRVVELGRRVDGLAQAAPAGPAGPRPTPPDPKREALRAAEVPALQAWLADSSRTEENRLQALRELRGRGPGARGGVAIQAAVELQTSPSASTRADVWRQMSSAREPALVPHLLRSLQNDPSSEVREEAAETLGDYREQAEVERALRVCSEHDADDKVRAQAFRSLGGRRR